MKRRILTEEEKQDYLNAISGMIFNKQHPNLNRKQRNTLKLNLHLRERNGELDPDTCQQLKEELLSK